MGYGCCVEILSTQEKGAFEPHFLALVIWHSNFTGAVLRTLH